MKVGKIKQLQRSLTSLSKHLKSLGPLVEWQTELALERRRLEQWAERLEEERKILVQEKLALIEKQESGTIQG